MFALVDFSPFHPIIMQDEPNTNFSEGVCEITSLSLSQIAHTATVDIVNYADDIQDDAQWASHEDYAAQPIHLYLERALGDGSRLQRVDHVRLYQHLLHGHGEVGAPTHWAARTVALGLHDADIFSHQDDERIGSDVPIQIFLSTDGAVCFVMIGNQVMAHVERAMERFFDLVAGYGRRLICASVTQDRAVTFVPDYRDWLAVNVA